MYFLIIAVLGLLVLTRFYKMDQVKSVRYFRLAWACLIASVAVPAIGQLLTITVNDKKEIALLTNAAMLAALAISLFLWHKAVTADDKKDQDNA
jgi:hypothetical protein